MFLLKSYFYIMAFSKKIVYKIIYGNKITFGKSTTFRKMFNVVISHNGKIIIGNNCFFNNGCSLNCLGQIEIGAGSIFGEGVRIYDHNHKFNDVGKSIKEQGYSIGEVKIGKNCWIGSNVIFLKGALVGDNCVVGAGCIVKEHVPNGTIVKSDIKLNVEKIRVK